VRDDGLPLDQAMCFIDDGHSGASLARPALEALRDAAVEARIQRLYVHSPDRLARDFVDQMVLVDELRRCGVELVFVNRALGDSPEDQLLLQVQGAMAQYERTKILERCRRGRLHAARCGSLAVLGKGSYGYRYVCKSQGGGTATLNVVLEEAHVVRDIFNWVGLERVSLAEVCRRLARRGIASPRGHALWDRSTLFKMLRNPLYMGRPAYGRTRAMPRRARLRTPRGQDPVPRRAKVNVRTEPKEWIHLSAPALVSEEVFQAVAEQLVENAKRQRRQREHARYLLQGLLVCACCGYAMIGRRIRDNGKIYQYYRCGGSNPSHGPAQQRCCCNTPVRCDRLDQAVWDDVVALLAQPARIEQEYRRRQSRDDSDQTTPGQRDLSTRLRQIQRCIERLLDAYQEGLVEKSEFEPRIQAARQHAARLQEHIKTQAQAQAEQEHLRLTIGRLEEFAEQIKSGLSSTQWDTRQQIIRALVKEIEIDRQDVRIVYKVRPGPFDPAPDWGTCQDCCQRQKVAWGVSPKREFAA
jgi:site-specific DNA recombinase